MSTFAPAALTEPDAHAIHAFGARFDGEVLVATRALFEGRRDLSIPEEGARHDDLAYGEDARQRLDLATCGAPDAPLLLYVPGGGFVGGDKSEYRHVGPVFARLGFNAVVMNYRLAPSHPWPAGARDVSAAIDWLADSASAFGAGGSAIYVLAQSAGAAHASGALFDPRLRPRSFGAVRASVLMSGFYQMRPDLEAGNLLAYFGADPSQYADRSPIGAVPGSNLPVGLTVAEYDPEFLAAQTLALALALTRRDGRCPPVIWNEGHNHVSPVLSLGTAPADLAPVLARTLLRLGSKA